MDGWYVVSSKNRWDGLLGDFKQVGNVSCGEEWFCLSGLEPLSQPEQTFFGWRFHGCFVDTLQVSMLNEGQDAFLWNVEFLGEQ